MRDSVLCAAYNHDIANGKWNGMMTQKHIGYTSWNDNFPSDRMPSVKQVEEGCGGVTFTEKEGMVVMEAEHFHTSTATPQTSWTIIPHLGRTRSGVTLMPYTEQTGDASLTYRFTMDGKQPEMVDVHVIVKSTLDYLNKNGMAFTVSIDNGEPQRIVFNDRLNEAKENIYSVFYPTVARRIVETTRRLPLSSQSTHTLTIHPEDPAIVFEKIVIDAGGYQPSFLFGQESPLRR